MIYDEVFNMLMSAVNHSEIRDLTVFSDIVPDHIIDLFKKNIAIDTKCYFIIDLQNYRTYILLVKLNRQYVYFYIDRNIRIDQDYFDNISETFGDYWGIMHGTI